MVICAGATVRFFEATVDGVRATVRFLGQRSVFSGNGPFFSGNGPFFRATVRARGPKACRFVPTVGPETNGALGPGKGSACSSNGPARSGGSDFSSIWPWSDFSKQRTVSFDHLSVFVNQSFASTD